MTYIPLDRSSDSSPWTQNFDGNQTYWDEKEDGPCHPHDRARRRLILESRHASNAWDCLVSRIEHALIEHEECRERSVLKIREEEIWDDSPTGHADDPGPGLNDGPPEE